MGIIREKVVEGKKPMREGKDPAIKLFGKTISLFATERILVDDSGGDIGHCSDGKILLSTDDRVNEVAAVDGNQEEQTSLKTMEEPTNSSAKADSSKSPSGDNKSKASKEEHSDKEISQDMPLKKPDTILPCPRCNSTETKFCYFNNYNVNQPRHFCKNCQRYWTAGGTMRNVPVGAGRRKSKNSSSQHRDMVIPEVFQSPGLDAVKGIIHPALRAKGGLLAFGNQVPLCESIGSGLNIGGQIKNCIPSVAVKPETMSNQSCASSVSPSSRIEKGDSGGEQERTVSNISDSPPQVPCVQAPPWRYSFSPVPWSTPVPDPSPLLASGFPMSLYSMPPYWGCSDQGAWNVRWGSQLLVPADHASGISCPDSPTLGKHTREGKLVKSSNLDTEEETGDHRSATLRIQDPSESAKGSIWASLGIKNEDDFINQRGAFKGLPIKGSA